MAERIFSSRVAGSFYPENPVALRKTLEKMENLATPIPFPPDVLPHGIIVPHAGYMYSGQVALNIYRGIVREWGAWLDDALFVVVAPSHRVGFSGISTLMEDAYQIPGGEVPIDRGAVDAILHEKHAKSYRAAFETEHSLEVQLPFIRRYFPRVKILPLVTGEIAPERLKEVFSFVGKQFRSFFILSSDMSHFLDDGSARRKDSETARAIVSLTPEDLDYESACGRTGIRGFLLMAKEYGWKGIQTEYRNSGEVSGDYSRVVGYGSFLFYEDKNDKE